jgi:hypothetical protein
MKKLLFKNYLTHLKRGLNNPLQCQAEVFTYLISQAKETFYGKLYKFNGVKNYSDYQQFVPIVQHEDLWPLIDKDLRTKKNFLWPRKSLFFAQSSGTTSAKKIIPVSRESLEVNHVLAGRMLLANYIYNLNPNFPALSGKSFALAGSRQHNSNYPNAYIADVSAILVNNLPFWAKLFMTPKTSISTSDMNWDSKLTAIAKVLVKKNVVSLSGVPSWMLRVLETCLKISNQHQIKDLWPNLSLFIHGGVNFEPYKSRFKEIIGQDIDYLNCYNASEGFFSFQDQLNSDEMLLLNNVGVFYEFRELNSQEVISLSQVRLNKVYALIISTISGLWRYEIGDTVKFTNLSPYRIKIVGRTLQHINLVGEELMVNQAEDALSYASALFDAHIIEFTVAPFFDGIKNYHQWYIEIDKGFDTSKFALILDAKLKDINADYKAKRNGNLLELPDLRILPSGSFEKYLKRANREGGQNKIPRLSNGRDFIKQLLDEHS